MQAVVTGLQIGHRLAELDVDALRELFGGGRNQCRLRRKVVYRGTPGYFGALDDAADRGTGIALMLQAFDGGIEQALAHGFTALFLGAAGPIGRRGLAWCSCHARGRLRAGG